MVGPPLAQVVDRQRADDRLLDRLVGQDPLDQPRQGVAWPLDPVGADRADPLGRETQVAEDPLGTLPLGIGHPRLGKHMHVVPELTLSSCAGAWV